MHFHGCVQIGRISAILLPALMAASIEAGDYSSGLLFDAARAFSQATPDTQDPFIRITGSKTFGYRRTFTLRGIASPYSVEIPPEQSLTAEIHGRLEGGCCVQGELFQSDVPIVEDRALLSISKGKDRLRLGDLPRDRRGGFLDPASLGRGAEFLKTSGRVSLEGLVSLPTAAPRSERKQGNGTQGPYRLSHLPILEGSESVTLIHGLTRTEVSREAYRLEYITGELVFTRDLVEEDRVIEVSYLQRGGDDIRTLQSVRVNSSLTDSASATLQVLRTYGARPKDAGTYSSCGLDSRYGSTKLQSELAFIHSESDPLKSAASNVALSTDVRCLEFNASLTTISSALTKLDESATPRRSTAVTTAITPSERLRLFGNYSTERRDSTKSQASCGFSLSLPLSWNLASEHTIESNALRRQVWDCLALSRAGRTYSMSASVTVGSGTAAGTRNHALEVQLSECRAVIAKGNFSYITEDGGPGRANLRGEFRRESDHIGSAFVSWHASRTGTEELRRTMTASLRTPEGAPLQLAAVYDLKCTADEKLDGLHVDETRDFTGMGKLSLARFQIDYRPRLSLSSSHEVSEHRVGATWKAKGFGSLSATTRIGGYTTDRTEKGALERGIAVLTCRIATNKGIQGDVEYERQTHVNPGLSSGEHIRWRWKALTAFGGESSLRLEAKDARNITTQADSGVQWSRDRSIEVGGTRRLLSWLTGSILAGFARKDRLDTDYSCFSGFGLEFCTARGSKLEFSYRTTLWTDLGGTSDEKVSLSGTVAEGWLSANCDIEYNLVSHPLSETLTISLGSSFQF